MTRATTFRATAIVGGFLLAILMIMTVSRAAFSDPTSNDENFVGSGSLVLYNNATNGGDPGEGSRLGDESGDEMFGTPAAGTWTVKADELAPGDSVSHCITIIHGGSVDGDVVLDSISSDAPSVSGFRTQIGVDIERFGDWAACTGTGPGSPVVTGGTLASYASSETPWETAVTDRQVYRITLTLDANALNKYQGATINNINFEWLATQA